MRFSSGNAFSYNVWAGSPLQYLENDNNDNTFFYERFEGRVAVGDASTGNRFELSSFSNPTGNCLTVAAPSTAYVFKSFFGPCSWDVVGNALVTLDRSVNTLPKVSKAVTVRFPGCTADFDLDGSVTSADRPTILARHGLGDRRSRAGSRKPTSTTTATWTRRTWRSSTRSRARARRTWR